MLTHIGSTQHLQDMPWPNTLSAHLTCVLGENLFFVPVKQHLIQHPEAVQVLSTGSHFLGL